MSGKLSFLDETETPEVEDEAEAVEATEDAETEGQGEEPEPEAADGEAEPPAATEEPEKPQSIPITALLDERDKRQKLERELAEIRRRLPQERPKQPDVLDDPEGFQSHVAAQFEQRLIAEKMAQSRFYAEREFGADAVREMVEFFNDYPQETERFMSAPSPFHAGMEYMRKQKLLAEIGDDPDGWKRRQLEQMQAQIAEPPAPKTPPPSVSKAPSAGKAPIKPGSAFDSLFGE